MKTFLCVVSTNFPENYEIAPLEPPGSNVLTVRFLFNKRHFNLKGIKAAAFMPRPNQTTGRWETSVIRIDGIGEAAIWQISAEVIEPYQGKPAKAWGEATVAEIRSVQLDVDVTPQPHPRHLDLVGWPLDDSPEEQRSKQ